MNTFLFWAIMVLVVINLLALTFSAVAFIKAYNLEHSFRYSFVMSILITLIWMTNLTLAFTLDDANQNGLSLLIQICILITCILLIKLLNKIDYNRNVKPNFQIKL